MIFNRSKLVEQIGERLRGLRKQIDFSTNEMARRVGLSRSGYYKQESGRSLPRLETLNTLQQEYDISMDWLFFNKGPVRFREKSVTKDEPKGIDPENLSPHVLELIEYMEKDPRLQHEILVQFFKYKEQKENPNPTQSSIKEKL